LHPDPIFLTPFSYGISCSLHECGPVPKLDRSAEIHIYRIIQESIGNAIKHGKAAAISIDSVAEEGCHRFIVTDNGSGCDGKPTAGMGLHIMQYRARLVGGTVEVNRPPDGGCRVTLEFPA